MIFKDHFESILVNFLRYITLKSLMLHLLSVPVVTHIKTEQDNTWETVTLAPGSLQEGHPVLGVKEVSLGSLSVCVCGVLHVCYI